MSSKAFSGHGRKRPQVNKPFDLLFLDSQNPRLPKEAQGKDEGELLSVLYKEFYLDELADSMAQNGYFDEEPLVAVPVGLPACLRDVDPNDDAFRNYVSEPNVTFTVVEGNRRLATVKILLSQELRDRFRIKHWPNLSEQVADDLRILPVIVYPDRPQVIAYLGVRHIVGIQKWDSYAKARYIAQLIEQGLSVKEVELQIGDKRGSATLNYVGYKILEQVEQELGIDTRHAQRDFSLLLLAMGQAKLKQFLGLPRRLADANVTEPITVENLENLRYLISWIFGVNGEQRVITDSRDITRYLSQIAGSTEATEYLNRTRDILGAYERTDGEEQMVLRSLITANRKLESALSVAHRHRTSDVLAEVEKCEGTVKALLRVVRNVDD